MERAGFFLLGLIAVFYFLLTAAALMGIYPPGGIALIIIGCVGLLVAQGVSDRRKDQENFKQ
ncbi:MAG: hypothetical protein K8I82_31710 [Anaerolineae bacterium]|nr:hypothetical protein [Anaerolineae bacterium]